MMATTTSVDRKWARELAQSLNWFAELRFGENCLRTLRTVADEACDEFKRTGEFHGEQLNNLLRHDLASRVRNHYHKITSLARGRRSELAEVFGSVDFANEFQSAIHKLAVDRLTSDDEASLRWFGTTLAIKNAAVSGSWWGENNPTHELPTPLPPHDEITAAFDFLREAGRRANDYLSASIVGSRTDEVEVVPSVDPGRDEEEEPSEAATRRNGEVPTGSAANVAERIRFLPRAYELDGQSHRLGGKPLTMLRELVAAGEEGRTREELDAAGWPETVVQPGSLNAALKDLRKSLKAALSWGPDSDPIPHSLDDMRWRLSLDCVQPEQKTSG